MLDHANEALILVQGKSRVDLDNDRTPNLALARLLEIIGEAASQISRGEQARYTAVPWSGIIGLRNRLIHGYDSIDSDIIWQILTSDLPALVPAPQQIIDLSEER
jgi:uncharacterized protein with HEPN domain